MERKESGTERGREDGEVKEGAKDELRDGAAAFLA